MKCALRTCGTGIVLILGPVYHAVKNKDEVLILQYHLWPYNFSHLTEAPPNYLCQINERIPPTQVMGLAVCQEAFWACKSDSSGSDCPTGGCLGEWTPQLSHSEPESFHGPGHLHQAQRPAWAFVGVTRERERASERKRETRKGERRRRRGLGCFWPQPQRNKVTQMGHRQATAGEKSDGHQCGWSKRERERGKDTTND